MTDVVGAVVVVHVVIVFVIVVVVVVVVVVFVVVVVAVVGVVVVVDVFVVFLLDKISRQSNANKALTKKSRSIPGPPRLCLRLRPRQTRRLSSQRSLRRLWLSLGHLRCLWLSLGWRLWLLLQREPQRE